MFVNALFSLAASLYFSVLYSSKFSTYRKSLNILIGLVLNIWGQYHFRRKMGDITWVKSVSIYDIFYMFFLFIIINVSYMMSNGVGNGS